VARASWSTPPAATDTADVDDLSDTTAGITYSLGTGGDEAAFSINAATGAVTLTGNPNDEAQGSYSFTVVATDAAGNASSQVVTLGINDLDESAPVFTSATTATAIAENSGAGQLVYTAAATDTADVDDLSDTTAGITYSLGTGGDEAAFSINAATGAVTLTGNPNDEAQGSYSFTVVATDAAGNASSQVVTLGINDLDESAPVFTSATTATAIAENSGAGQLVYTAAATDTADVDDLSDTTAGITYSLGTGGDEAAFSINAATGAVTLTGNPNDEAQGSYSFTVVATDAAGNASSQVVTLGINDLDESAPVFTSATTATAIAENSGAGQLVYTAAATDTADVDDLSDTTAGITYSLGTGGDEAAFSINAATGAVTLTGNPNDEAQGSYSFTVVATDAAGNASSQVVTLGINDLDESAPVFTSATTATAIAENSGAGQLVYTAAATDTADVDDLSDTTAGITYSLGTGGDEAAFSINAATGAVTLTGNPNDEAQGSYSFTVVATDAAGNASSQVVTLGINDLDESAPVFTSATTATAIAENSGAGQLVYTAAATDTADVDDLSDTTAGITYSLGTGGDEAAFSINAATGAVTLTGNPNDEAQGSYSFTVVATDAAGNASSQVVTLGINDLDESAPVFTSATTATAIAENSGAGQLVYTAAATDTADVDDLSDTTAGITYSLGTGGDEAAFSINAATGAVTLTGNPNDEAQGSYSFTVVATDAAGNASSQVVTLGINDLDESAPVFTSATTATAIAENSGAGQLVYTAAATDTADVDDLSDTTAGITYSLGTGGDEAAFSINAATGAVTLTGNPNDEAQGSYSFTVVATDAAGNASSQVVTLGINDLDESAPVFTSATTATAIAENSGAGQLVYTAAATDTADVDDLSDTTAGITYSLGTGGDEAAFSINAATGAVTLTGNPNDEAQGSYSFTVVATDAAGNASSQVVTLGINDLDESAPVFTSATTATAIAENSGAGQLVYTAAATDTADVDDLSDTTAGITYSLGTGGDEAAFSINAATGAVTLTGNPNDEAQGSYSFTVVATDAAGNASSQVVTLGINDLDESAPVFTSATTATAIAENSGAGQLVYTAAATDTADVDDLSDTTAGITYSLGTGGDEAAFSINAATGAVTLTGNPNYEAKSSYSFTVVATDAAGNASSQVVSLAINDLDEIPPTAVVTSITQMVDDTGAEGDFVTSDASVDISGTFSGTLGVGESIQVSANNGANWVTATTIIGSVWVATGVALIPGEGTLITRTIDAANNVTPGASEAYTLDTAALASISLNDITADNVVNIAESAGMVAVTGSVGGEVQDGDTVTLTVNGIAHTGAVSGGIFSIDVASSNLVADPDKIVDASVSTTDTAGNSTTATTTKAYGVDVIAPTAVTTTLASITDHTGNPGDFITSDGSVTVQGLFRAPSASVRASRSPRMARIG
jgi:hypothetical protein